MAVHERRLPRTQQPQDGAKLDLSNALTRGLLWSYDYAGRSLGGVAHAVTYRSGYGRRVGSQGIAVEPNVANAGFTFVVPSTTLDEYTLVVVADLPSRASPVGGDAVLVGNASGIGVYEYNAGADLKSFAYYAPDYSGTAAAHMIDIGISVVPASGRLVVVQTYRRGAHLRNYVNGAFINQATPLDYPARWGGGWYGSEISVGSHRAQTIGVQATWLQAASLDDEEARRVSGDPWQAFEPQRIWVPVSAGGGGTTFEQAVGGSLTLSGALRKQAAKRTTGSLTATGVLWKQATKLVLGSLTPAGGLAKQTSKYPSGSLAAAGGLVKQTDKAAGGAITGTGSLQRQTNKGTSGSLTLVGLLSKLTSRTLTGSSVPVGAVRKLTEKTALTGSITGSGALATAAVLTHAIAGSITAVGALAKTTLKAAAGSIGLTGVLTKLTQKALSGSLTPQGALSRLTARLVSGSITPAGALAISYQAARAVAGSITAVGALGKLTLKRVVGGITAAGSLAASFIPGGGPTGAAARWFNKLVLTVRKHRRRR